MAVRDVDSTVLRELGAATVRARQSLDNSFNNTKRRVDSAPGGWDRSRWEGIPSFIRMELEALDREQRELYERAAKIEIVAAIQALPTPLPVSAWKWLLGNGALIGWVASNGPDGNLLDYLDRIVGVMKNKFALTAVASAALLAFGASVSKVPGRIGFSGAFLKPLGVSTLALRTITGVTLRHGKLTTVVSQVFRGPLVQKTAKVGSHLAFGLVVAGAGVKNVEKYGKESTGKALLGTAFDVALIEGGALVGGKLGSKGGAAVGGLVGGPPGAVIGLAVGGVAGKVAGGFAGEWVASELDRNGVKDRMLDAAEPTWKAFDTQAKIVTDWAGTQAAAAGKEIGKAARAFDDGVKSVTEAVFSPFRDLQTAAFGGNNA